VYSEKIILRNLDAFASREGWMPVAHSIDQVNEFIEYVNSITTVSHNSRSSNYTLKANLTQNRAARIRRWVQNEQAMCALDSTYFTSRYAWVIDHRGEVFKFQNRKAQQVFDNLVAEHDEQQRSIEFLVLKARQLGITTKTAIDFVQRVQFVPNTQAVMGSVILDKSELIQNIIETCISRLPWWLVPQRSKDTKKLISFGNGSMMSIQSGTQATGIAQGWTPTLIHLSEIGDIPNPKKTIEEGLLPAAHSSAKLFLILEGTGNGSVGWQADKWRACKEDWPKGLSRLRPVFIPWPMAPDLYPEPDWLRTNPVPSDWQPLEVTRKHVRRCELYIHSTDYLERVVGKDWKMSREQQWFWEFKYREYARTHSQKIWFSQMPADDYEALQGKNDLVFDPIVVETVETDRKREFQAYAVTGNSIDEGFEPHVDEIDYDLPRIRVEWTSHRAQRYDWLLVPLKPFDESNERKALDKVLIFEQPNMRPGHEGEPQDYSIGVDTADGLGHEDEERSVLSIARSMTKEEVDEQCAELCSNRLNAPQMVGFAACLAAWYGKNTIDPRGCKFAIEQRERPGDDCQLQLKLMGFTFHHVDVRYDSKKLDQNKGHKEGWYSTAWSVPMLMNRYIDAIVNGWYKPNSRYLIAECGSLERKLAASRGKSKMEHQSGKFDDRVRAAAQSYFTRHAFDVMADRTNRRYRPPTNKLPEIIDTPATLARNDYLVQKMMEGF
jgi:hypothetical protein